MDKLNEIMKPYFEKKEEINNLGSKNFEIRKLRLSLEKLRDNKEQEIQDYITNYTSGSNFYDGFSSVIRKDLERSYENKENEILNKINQLENGNDYSRVYLYELAEIKVDLRKPLMAEKANLEKEFKKTSIEFDIAMLDLSNFKYEYNDQHQVLNGAEYKKLYEKTNEILLTKNEIKKQLKQLEEYLNLTELTKEESSVFISGLYPFEKAEYDRRKEVLKSQDLPEEKVELPTNEVLPEEINSQEFVDALDEISDFSSEEEHQDSNEADSLENSDSKEEVLDVSTSEENNIQEIKNKLKDAIEKSNEERNKPLDLDIVPVEEPSLSAPDDLEDSFVAVEPEFKFVNGYTVVDDYENLAGVIYNDIVDLFDGINSIIIDSSSDPKKSDQRYLSIKDTLDNNYYFNGSVNVKDMKLPNGEFINVKDIEYALDNYYTQSKGNIYIVDNEQKSVTVSKKDIRKIKKALKNCSTIKLLKEDKLSESDLVRVYGKENFDQFKYMDSITAYAPSGEYISRDEFLFELKELFSNKNKKREWLSKLSNKLKSFKSNRENYEEDSDYSEVFELDLDDQGKTK